MDFSEFEREAELYVGTKEIMATPMDSIAWAIMANKTYDADRSAIPGFAVMYLNSDDANLPGYPHYVSWSPAKTFEEAYHKNGELTGMQALSMLKYGYKAYYTPAGVGGYYVYKAADGETVYVHRNGRTTEKASVLVDLLLKPEWAIEKIRKEDGLVEDTYGQLGSIDITSSGNV